VTLTPSFVLPSVSHRLRLACLALLMAFALIATGCSSFGSDETDETANWPVERLFNAGKADMNAGAWQDASDRFMAVEARFPFGPYAQQALINLAYVQWKTGEPELALATISRFQRQYPSHPGSDYMLFLRGLILFTPPSAALSFLTQQDPAERDPQALRESYDSFNTLVTRYPQSRYADDARSRMNWLINTMAENQLHTAEFYFKRAAYVAAINRAQVILTDFEGVPAAEEALYIIMASYEKLGMPELSKDAERVLLQNYPDTVLIAQGLPESDYSYWNPLRYF